MGQRCPECIRREGTQRIVRVRDAGAVSARGTPVTMGVIGVTVAIFLLQLARLPIADVLFEQLAMWNLGIREGEWWRMLTVVLLHANVMHIMFNMWAVYVLGPQIERELGGVRFLALYLASAAGGSAFAFHLGDLSDVGVGASGAIFGLFGVWLASAVRRRNTAYGRFLLSQLGVILAINAAIPFIVRNVSWQAHLGGLLTGFVIGYLWAVIKGRQRYQLHLATAAVLLAVAVASTQLV